MAFLAGEKWIPWGWAVSGIAVSRRLDFEGAVQTLLGELLAEFGSW